MIDDDATSRCHAVAVPVHVLAVGQLCDEPVGDLHQDDRRLVDATRLAADVSDDATTAYLVGMWVAPDLRGSGVARELVEHVIEWSRVHGRTRVVLSVEGGNAAAARLYEKCGFVELDEPPPLPYEPRPGTRSYAYSL